MFVYVCMGVYACACVHACMCVCVCVFVKREGLKGQAIYIYIYKYIYVDYRVGLIQFECKIDSLH